MEFIRINDHCCYFHGAVNIGYVHDGDNGLIIDAGIDKSTSKKVLRELENRGLPVTHLFITHAHADHYGGAAHIQSKYPVHTIAPHLESAILENPILEPLYLFGGNDPISELRNKFLEGPPIKVDSHITEGVQSFAGMELEFVLLPGHSYQQLGVKAFDVLYAADSYFAIDQLKKHRIPYITDAKLTIKSLEKLLQIKCSGAVPGHGEYEEDFKATVRGNIDYHQKLLDWLRIFISGNEEGISHEAVVRDMCNHFSANPSQLGQWLLFRTAVTAYVTALYHEGSVIFSIKNNTWLIEPKRED
ncbi:MBL fold metallo-hydrolase [Thalassobacillus pellis]|uniref:MBL fold metallo-hydrolase n=1 Tax=Thalassobacillus pellis TaxID=748008 RepID=UPI0019604D95|nr:MBL fold metallo-hydrolase [Thalassobacillus pellis]MBM7554000.1 glyoxylase-like metal-dependent hydrolase (beta-lactamase superfamily II) [Thalassobacillus pellis]